MNTKNNKRFHETEIRMEAAMLEIMKNTEFEKITVKKICEKANVNRSTFYAHFIDIYDMIDKMEMELSRELLNEYSSYNKQELQIFSEKSFVPFLNHIKKHKYFYKINLQTTKDFPLKQGFERLWEVIKMICIKKGITSDEEIMYYLIYFQAGLTMTLKHWIDTGCKEDEAKLARIIKKCIPSTLI